MTFVEMIDALRRFWIVTVAFTLVALAVAAAAATVPETKYEARATLLAQPDAERVDFAAVEAVRFLLPSLAELVSTNTFRGQVGERLQPQLPASEVDARADFEPGTGIVHITGTDPDPGRAQRITQVAAVLLGRQELSDAVVIAVLDPPELPTSPAGPGTAAYLLGGLVLGLLGGVLAAIVLAAAARTRAQTVAPVPPQAPPEERADVGSADAAIQPSWTDFERSSAAVPATASSEPLIDEARAAAVAQAGVGVVVRSELETRLSALGVRLLGSIPVKHDAADAATNGTNDFDRAFRELAATLATESRTHPHLLVSSAHAGVGRTTVAANVAWALATAGSAVVAIDGDVEDPMLHRFLRVPSEPGLSDIARVGPDGVSQRSAVESLAVVSAGGASFAGTALLEEATAQLLATLGEGVAIIDGPPLTDLANTAALARATGAIVLVVDGAGAGAVEEAVEGVNAARGLGVELVGAVLNRASL